MGQALEVDLELSADLRASGLSDRLEDTVDYGQAIEIVRHSLAEGKHRLLEHSGRRHRAPASCRRLRRRR